MITPARTILLSMLALVSLPAVAGAAAPPPVVNLPSAASLAASKPVFTWTNNSTGETIDSLSISTAPTTTESGDLASTSGGDFQYPLRDVTSVSADMLYAGVYYFNAGWRLSTDETYESGYTPVQSFTIPAYVNQGSGIVTQYNYLSTIFIDGKFHTNAKASTVWCRVYRGTRLIAQQKVRKDYAVLGGKTTYFCDKLKVSEKLDGVRLRATVQFSAGGKKSMITRSFRAR